MKAVVVEIKNGSAAVLSDDGCIISIKNNGYEIGQIIRVKKPGFVLPGKIAAFTAAAAAFVVLSAGSWAYASPYTYISIDVNPSVEFTVNRFNRVLSAEAVNEDAEEIFRQVSLDELRNKPIEEAIINTISTTVIACSW